MGGVSGERIPPGYYTSETLPPLSEGARKILASVDAVAPLVDVPADPRSKGVSCGITLADDGMEGIRLSDEGQPGMDPDNFEPFWALGLKSIF
jgi:hypothetical protein